MWPLKEEGLNDPGQPRFLDVKLSTGVRLNYAEQGDSDGYPIIMLHGYTDSWFSYSRVLPLLSSKCHAYALSQRGHGDSEKPTDGYAMPELASDVLAFMDAMELGQPTVVGHSMGSLVAQEIALAAPDRLSRLVLIGSATNIRSDEIRELQRVVNELADPVPREFAREFQVSTIHHPVPDEFLDRAVDESLKLPARVWRAALEGQLSIENSDRIESIETPTLLLRGDHDQLFPREAQDALVDRLPNATFKLYPETGHALHWERPNEFVRDFEAFCATNL